MTKRKVIMNFTGTSIYKTKSWWQVFILNLSKEMKFWQTYCKLKLSIKKTLKSFPRNVIYTMVGNDTIEDVLMKSVKVLHVLMNNVKKSMEVREV